MKAIIQFVVRQSSFAALLFFLFSLLNAWSVGEGFWQGSGLHGYVIHQNQANGSYNVSTWRSFLNMLITLGFTVFFGLIAMRKNGCLSIGFGMGCLQIGNVGVVENPGQDNVLRTKSRRKNHQQHKHR
ncbi:MAG: hypothetical protein ACRYFS_14030 [Janthinobacterium lividum]